MEEMRACEEKTGGWWRCYYSAASPPQRRYWGQKTVRNRGFERKWGKRQTANGRKNEREGKISHFISPRRIKSRPLDHAQYESKVGNSEARSTVGIKGLFKKFKPTVKISIRQSVTCPNDERRAAQALKEPDLNRRVSSLRHHMSSTSETAASAKTDTEEKASRPLNRLPAMLATV